MKAISVTSNEVVQFVTVDKFQFFFNINNACVEPKEGNFEGKIKSDLPYPGEDFWCSPQLPRLSLSSSFFGGNQITYAYFSSFSFPTRNQMAEGHHHGAIHEEEDSEDGKDFERFKNVFEMGRQI